MAQETFYDVLGVKQDASEAEIKKAYRKLVRQYHPDVSQDPKADEMMSKINQAYNTLKSKEKRAEYDAMLNHPFQGQQTKQDFNGFDFSQFNTGNRGYQFRREDFGDSGAFGTGDFRFDDIFSAFGEHQQGFRQQQNGPTKGEDQHATLRIDIKEAYHGAKRNLTINMPTRDDNGQMTTQQKTFSITIPKGIGEGQQIRLAGQGLPSRNGGASGDLFLKIHFRETPKLYVDNKKDVHLLHDVYPWQIALGDKITLETPAGTLAIRLPDNTTHGQKIRLKGKGIPAADDPGDLYIHIHITMPVIHDADKALWQQLAAHYGQGDAQ